LCFSRKQGQPEREVFEENVFLDIAFGGVNLVTLRVFIGAILPSWLSFLGLGATVLNGFSNFYQNLTLINP
jgi:hypothetical protein